MELQEEVKELIEIRISEGKLNIVKFCNKFNISTPTIYKIRNGGKVSTRMLFYVKGMLE